MDLRAVFCLDLGQLAASKRLAAQFNLPWVNAHAIADARQKERTRFFCEQVGAAEFLAFQVSAEGLELVLVESGQVLAVQADFAGPSVRYRREKGGGRNEMIARAVGVKTPVPRVFDATAGLGGDAFVLASLGCPVSMAERVPAIRALLADGLARARASGGAALTEIIGRMDLIECDSIEFLESLCAAELPDVIYLDPMFPVRRKSAAVKKAMQVIQRVVGPDDDADRLLELALEKAGSRVVVKRPRTAPKLAGPEPQHVLEGKRNRYDVYLK